jgi:hypothetical protein
MAKKSANKLPPVPARSSGIRDRVKELRRVRAGDIVPNDRNWRTHPDEQRAAMQGVLREIGYADALLARELPDGTLALIDGHLRRESAPDEIVPVFVLDVTEAEADKLLVTLDPLAAMAGADALKLDELLRDVETGDQALATMLEELAAGAGLYDTDDEANDGDDAIPESFQVVVECADEREQQAVYDRMTQEGRKCRVLTA